MNNLPSEILHSIFIQLSLKERLECTLVCRYWSNCLSKRSLLYDVDFPSDRKFDKFISMLQRFPSRAIQVEMLTLKISRTIDKRMLLNLLPNLRVFKYSSGSCGHESNNHCAYSLELQHSNSKIEMITDEQECELTRQLLRFGSCTQLSCLQLDLRQVDDPRGELFIHLKNARNLNILSLWYAKLGIEDLEIIHKNVPNLDTLYFYEMKLNPCALPISIIPATSIKTLIIYMPKVQDNTIYLDWYTYLGKKYTNMTSFNCQNDEMFIFELLTSLKIYRDGLLPIYRAVGSPISNYFFSDIPIELNPFATLDTLGVGIADLLLKNNDTRPIFEQLATSHQSKHIQLLDLHSTALASPTMLQRFTSLNELYIDKNSRCYYKWDVNLTDFFNAFPATLASFHANIKDAVINEVPSRSNNIQSLILKCDVLYPKLGDAISHCCPKLTELELQGKAKENISIILPSNRFKRMHLEIECTGDATHAYSIINSNSHKYYWKTDQTKTLTPTTYEELLDRVIITLHYASATYIFCDQTDLRR